MTFFKKTANYIGDIIRNMITIVTTYLITIFIMLVGILLVFVLFWFLLRLYDGNWPT